MTESTYNWIWNLILNIWSVLYAVLFLIAIVEQKGEILGIEIFSKRCLKSAREF